jgi:hypothetical protein
VANKDMNELKRNAFVAVIALVIMGSLGMLISTFTAGGTVSGTGILDEVKKTFTK